MKVPLAGDKRTVSMLLPMLDCPVDEMPKHGDVIEFRQPQQGGEPLVLRVAVFDGYRFENRWKILGKITASGGWHLTHVIDVEPLQVADFKVAKLTPLSGVRA